MKIQHFWNDLLHLFFPEMCAGCDRVLTHQEKILCTHCLYQLPLTDYHKDDYNDLFRQLLGKANIQYAFSMLKLSKDSIVEKLLHQLKFGNRPEIGVYLGAMYGITLSKEPSFETFDLVVPIPTHHSKKRVHGYNQAAQIAKGLVKSTGLDYSEKVLIRDKSSDSQVTKSRLDRYLNVEGVFSCTDLASIQGKHIILVDDVLTTGATLASATNTLLDAGDGSTKVSIVTLARA